MRLRYALGIGAFFLFLPHITQAQLSPGDLHASHAFLEGVENCRKCHNSDRTHVSENCLNCHLLMRDRIESQRGLHSRKEYRRCELCHIEHQGRDFALVYWPDGPDRFDHNRTAFPLDGAHIRTRCRACHTAANISDRERLTTFGKNLDQTFLGLDTTCVNCHFDEHRAQFPQSCAVCHTTETWKPAPGFAHNRSKFILTGKHRSTPCGRCHETVRDGLPGQDLDFLKFTQVPHDECTDCHKDVHAGKLGRVCDICHSTATWILTDTNRFDHDRTRYPLAGRHASLPCRKCHQSGRPHAGVAFTQCRDCHTDYHFGAFVSRSRQGACEDCHTVTGFRPAVFPQARHDSTDYPLLGAHRAVACNACHPQTGNDPDLRQAQFVFPSTRCRDCHPSAHGTQLKRQITREGCGLCHGVAAWQSVAFDHDRTGYPLLGRHRDTGCRPCHRTAPGESFPDSLLFAGIPRLCDGCHRDPHDGQFTSITVSAKTDSLDSVCEACHLPEHWQASRFDHNRDSRYQLDGAHRRVPCNGCHPTRNAGNRIVVQYRPLPHACKDCHGNRYPREGSGS